MPSKTRVSAFRPHRDDVLLCVVSVLAGVFLWSLGVHSSPNRNLLPDWAALVPLVVLGAMELLRRTAPRVTLPVGTVGIIADQFTVGNMATVLIFTDLMYAAVVYGKPSMARRLPVSTGLITIAVTIASVAWLRTPQALLIGVITGIVSFGPALTGATLRNHREAAEAARLRAEQTALLAEMDRSQAVVAERARMARELHDMVANHLSAIAIHSTAALSIDSPATSRDALGVIRENSVQGLAEMRRLIGLLRDAGAEQEPVAVPSLDGLDVLVNKARVNGAGSGLDFVLEDTRADGEPLPAPVELAAYRIVQESLTNALKHAVAGTVRVRLTSADGLLTVRVDSPYGERPGPRAPGSGAGLVGMRERTELLGGAFRAGRAGTVWQVRASLPAEEKAVTG
ncbi:MULTISPECIES: sensor histidine kinase [unclassified Streptomyces]|uniref:sensor histidine kinase n=1 Tax=unclassified Streptomyces TaxID=2593676 RepID=UPI00227120C8|nr:MULTISPECIES: histidine kinase [unclassified Streptomyces]MCY0917284.1 histidine kinase [Streptomyces sp. H27-G5]MCY0957599.1 histidine kinase [Streptomyces sp. H27-H5]